MGESLYSSKSPGRALSGRRLSLACLKDGGEVRLSLLCPKAEIAQASLTLSGLEPYRQKNPCADPAQWDRHLKEAGFSGCDVVMDDYSHGDCQEASLILSTAVDDTPAVEKSLKISIILDPANYAQVELAGELEAQLVRAGLANVTQRPVGHSLIQEDPTNSLDITVLEGYSPHLYEINEQEFKRLQSLLSSTRNLIWVNGGGRTRTMSQISARGRTV